MVFICQAYRDDAEGTTLSPELPSQRHERYTLRIPGPADANKWRGREYWILYSLVIKSLSGYPCAS